MLPNTRALLTFAGRFLLIFFFILPLWFLLTPAYNRLLASSANQLLALIEKPRITILVGWKENIAIVRPDMTYRRGFRIRGFTGYLTHFNLILMVALVLAPRRIEWRRRARALGIALGLLFILHVLYLLIGVKFFQYQQPQADQGSAGPLVVWGLNFYLSMASQLFPVLIWMALYPTMRRVPVQDSAFEGESAAGGGAG